MKIPVLFLIFKRIDTSLEAFKSIKQYQPDRLYIAADGPRNPEESKQCNELRNLILDQVTWPCEVKTLFRDENLGCTKAVNDGITWFFENEEYGIINEDDIVLSLDFYKLCEELLPKYSNNSDILMISSRNHSQRFSESNKYVFNLFANIWGWATWKRAWKYNDLEIKGWKQVNKFKLIKDFGLFQGLMYIRNFNQAYNSIEAGSWDTRWTFEVWHHNGLVITPLVNLSVNVGIGGSEGAHYEIGDIDPYQNLKIGKMFFPLEHPMKIELDKEQIKADRKDYFRVKMIGLNKKVRKLC